MGEINLNEAVYAPILDFLADFKIKSFAQIEESVRSKNVNFLQVGEALVLLMGLGHVASAQDEQVIAKVRKQTEKLNAFLCRKARGAGDIGFLASPVTGGGIQVNRFEQLFLVLMANGRRNPADLAQGVWQVLSSQGQTLVKEGRTIETADDNLSELTGMAEYFATVRLPILKALQIA